MVKESVLSARLENDDDDDEVYDGFSAVYFAFKQIFWTESWKIIL